MSYKIGNYSGQFKLRLPKTLHKTLAEDSKKEGVGMNQYCVYLLAKNSEAEHINLVKNMLYSYNTVFKADKRAYARLRFKTMLCSHA